MEFFWLCLPVIVQEREQTHHRNNAANRRIIVASPDKFLINSCIGAFCLCVSDGQSGGCCSCAWLSSLCLQLYIQSVVMFDRHNRQKKSQDPATLKTLSKAPKLGVSKIFQRTATPISMVQAYSALKMGHGIPISDQFSKLEE